MPQAERPPSAIAVTAGRAGPPEPPPGSAEILDLLRNGEVELKGRVPWSSNATFLVAVTGAHGTEHLAIYKPARGERPLWDFPRGLWRREVAAYQLAVALGWAMVPPTAARLEAPMGPGSLQLWVDADFEQHYFTLLEIPEHHRALRRIAAFDLIANNADRKAGHCLLDATGAIWAIDNGLCFHPEPKLRTVIWDFGGSTIDSDFLGDLAPLALGELPDGLDAFLDDEEMAAVVARAAAVLQRARFPRPKAEHHYPWPLI